MTTNFLDNKICTFKILLSWRFPREQAFLDNFPLCPQGPPSKAKILFLLSSCRLMKFLASHDCRHSGRQTCPEAWFETAPGGALCKDILSAFSSSSE